jgi:hypothetical protein
MRGLRSPILCDAPSGEIAGMSPNHGGYIIQILYPDGRTAVLTSAKVNGGHDDMFSNFDGKVGAGYGREDVVLAPSDATPNIFVINMGRSRSILSQ